MLMWDSIARLIPQNVAVLRGCMAIAPTLWSPPAEKLASSSFGLERAASVSEESLQELKKGRGVKARLPGVF